MSDTCKEKKLEEQITVAGALTLRRQTTLMLGRVRTIPALRSKSKPLTTTYASKRKRSHYRWSLERINSHGSLSRKDDSKNRAAQRPLRTETTHVRPLQGKNLCLTSQSRCLTSQSQCLTSSYYSKLNRTSQNTFNQWFD